MWPNLWFLTSTATYMNHMGCGLTPTVSVHSKWIYTNNHVICVCAVWQSVLCCVGAAGDVFCRFTSCVCGQGAVGPIGRGLPICQGPANFIPQFPLWIRQRMDKKKWVQCWEADRPRVGAMKDVRDSSIVSDQGYYGSSWVCALEWVGACAYYIIIIMFMCV